MLATIPLIGLLSGLAVLVRFSGNGGIRVSPAGLSLTLLSAGCIVIGLLLALPAPDNLESGVQADLVTGLANGGALFLAALPVALLFLAALRFGRLRYQ